MGTRDKLCYTTYMLRMSRILRFAIFGVLLGTFGCADKDSGGDGGTDEGGDPVFEPVPARGGLTIRRVEFNPSIGVDIAQDGAWVGASGRQGQIPRFRTAMARIFWGDLPADWVPRKLIARFTVEKVGGEIVEFDNYRGPLLVENESDEGSFNDQFFVQLPAQHVEPGAKFQVQLMEGEEGYEDIPEISPPSVALLDGSDYIGVEASPMETRVVIVPVQYTWNECVSDTATLTDAEKQGFADLLAKSNPIEAAKVVWRETGIVRTTQIGDPPDLWGALQQIRAEDEPDPNVFYYALYDSCGGPFGTLGTAPTANIPPTKSSATARFASGKWHKEQNVTAWETFVHEIGHVQSNPHAPCGGAAGTDPAYPHQDANIGVWGFDIDPQKPGLFIYAPNTGKDYMSYCSPSWVSDYRWKKLFDHMRELTSWDYESAAPTPDAEGAVKLTGVVYDDGSQRWWVVDGLVADEVGHTMEPIRSGDDATALSWPAVRSDIQDMEGSSFIQIQLGSEDDVEAILGSGLQFRLDGLDYAVEGASVEDLRRAKELQQP